MLGRRTAKNNSCYGPIVQLFDWFPILKVCCAKANTDEIDNLVKEKCKTLHDSVYNNPKQHVYTINGAKENYVDEDLEPFKHAVHNGTVCVWVNF